MKDLGARRRRRKQRENKRINQTRRDKLEDSYIVQVIKKSTPNIEPEDIPKELIEITKLIIQTKRSLKKQIQ